MTEKEYIERGALIAEYDRVHIGAPGGARKLMVDAPAADVVEVKHGYWVGYETDSYGMRDEKVWYKCSECGKDANGRCEDDEWYSYPILSAFCPHCGAKMVREYK